MHPLTESAFLNKDVSIVLLAAPGKSSMVLTGRVHHIGEGLMKLHQGDKIVWIPIQRIDIITEVNAPA